MLPQFVAATGVVLVAALVSGSLEGIGRMDLGSWGLIALLGTACTALPFGALLWLSELTTAARSGPDVHIWCPLSVWPVAS